MKFLCLLLAIYVVLLSAKPCCADNDCQGKVEHSQKTPAKEKECPGCSPFFTCGSCAGFIIAQPIILQLPEITPVPAAYGNVYQQPNVEKVALSIWLPPKLS